ncbi:hypothetical protein NNA34_14205 [Lacticaseibacillus paracasei]|uniref:hypothetical protein n=1 Tax=Lacticaseibacillus paracasei TaxID=1597 RepID=UPI002875D468|nr:hypothetical protein [Lacticaseibacillus paracasei]MDS0491419.1 hypothetical protein [Lacticaseibacillus paracasei]
MKYFETKEPYYSLIVANNAEEAKKIYREMYGDQDEPEQFKELSREEALYHLTIAKTEDGDILAYEEVQKSLDEKVPSMLLVDGAIL